MGVGPARDVDTTARDSGCRATCRRRRSFLSSTVNGMPLSFRLIAALMPPTPDADHDDVEVARCRRPVLELVATGDPLDRQLLDAELDRRRRGCPRRRRGRGSCGEALGGPGPDGRRARIPMGAEVGGGRGDRTSSMSRGSTSALTGANIPGASPSVVAAIAGSPVSWYITPRNVIGSPSSRYCVDLGVRGMKQIPHAGRCSTRVVAVDDAARRPRSASRSRQRRRSPRSPVRAAWSVAVRGRWRAPSRRSTPVRR